MVGIIEALLAEISDLEDQLTADPRYEKLQTAKRLLEMYQAPTTTSSQRLPGLPGSRPFASGASADIMNATKDILSRRGGPTPTRIILSLLAARDVEVGGAKPLNTLSSILSKSGAFVPHGRSGWTLAVPNGHDTEKAGDESFTEAASPTLLDHRPDHPVPPAKGREAVPGGGT